MQRVKADQDLNETSLRFKRSIEEAFGWRDRLHDEMDELERRRYRREVVLDSVGYLMLAILLLTLAFK